MGQRLVDNPTEKQKYSRLNRLGNMKEEEAVFKYENFRVPRGTTVSSDKIQIGDH